MSNVDSVAERFAAFPGHWHYAHANNQRDAKVDEFHGLIGELLFEEHFASGMAATKQIDDMIVAARAQGIKAWLPQARQSVERMLAAQDHLETADASAVAKEAERARKAHEKALAKLAEAQTAADAAETAKKSAEVAEAKLREAESALNSSDQVLMSFWRRYKESRAA